MYFEASIMRLAWKVLQGNDAPAIRFDLEVMS